MANANRGCDADAGIGVYKLMLAKCFPQPERIVAWE